MCDAPGDQTEITGTDDFRHGSHFVWRDRRSGGSDIYGVRLGPDGQPLWTSNGIAISDAPGEQYGPIVVADSPSGAWVVWTDERSGSPSLYVQRMESDGQVRAGWPSDGRRIAAMQGTASAWSDLEGGIMLFWNEAGSSNYRRLHLDHHGAPYPGSASDSGSVVHSNRHWSDGLCSYSTTTLSSAFSIWPDRMVVTYGEVSYYCYHHPCGACLYDDYAVTRIFNDQEVINGGAQWNDRWVLVVPDGAGGVLGVETSYLMTRMGVNGHPTWTQGSPLTFDRLVWNGDGIHVLGYGSDYAVERLVRLDDWGQLWPGWPADGVAACTGCGTEDWSVQPQFVPDGMGGALLAWRPRSPTNADLFANWITGVASYGWASTSFPFARNSTAKILRGLIGNGKGDAIAYWQDSRNGNADLWAYRISYDAPPPGSSSKTTHHVEEAGATAIPALEFTLDGAAPNPTQGELAVRFQLPRSGRAAVTVTDIAGRTVLRRALDDLAAGPHHVKLAGPGTLAPGVYLIRLEFAGAALIRRFVVIR